LKKKDLETKACPQIFDPINPLKITNSFKDDLDLEYHIIFVKHKLLTVRILPLEIKI
jgi:hypothetical protein